MTVDEVASWIDGTVSGDGTLVLSGATSLDDAGQGDLTFVDGKKNAPKWAGCPAAAAIVSHGFPDDTRPLIRVAEPLAAFLKLLLKLRGDRSAPLGIDPRAIVHPTAVVGPNSSVGPFAMIGEGSVVGANAVLHAGAIVGRYCTLGDDVTMYHHAVIYDDCRLGHRVTLHAGAVIGADGFGYKMVNGKHERIPQLGTVILEDDVEIGANSAIDRGTIGPTRIGAGTKIDNLAMIGHNCNIGRHNIIIAQVGIAGSCSTGDYVILGGQVGVADHIHIGTKTMIAAQSGVISDVPESVRYSGTPAIPIREFFRSVSGASKVRDLARKVKRLERHLKLDDGEAS